MTTTTTDLEELADTISATSKVIKGFLASNNLPQLSFSKDAPIAFPDSPDIIRDARRNLREASKKIYDLVTGPVESLTWLSTHYHDCSSLDYLCHYKIAEAVPLDGEVTFAEIASKAHVDKEQVRRILRYAFTNNLFCEPRNGYVGHTAGSRLLLLPGIKDLIGYASEDSFPAASKLVETTEKFGYSEELNEAPFNIAFNTDLPIFQYYDQDPVRGPRFAKAMGALTSSEGYHIKHLLSGYDWAQLGEALVVDVGGSSGHASIAIAEVAPQLKFVVQDMPNIVAQAESSSPLPANLKDRVSFMAHDFFAPQPVQADVYLLRFILHDYSDKYAITILKNLVPALKSGARLVIMDSVIPPPGVIPPSEERLVRIMDLQVMTLLNAKERELHEWASVFAKADPRLKVRNTACPPGSVMAIMELVFDS